MRRALRTLLLAGAVAGGTAAVGWWAVPLLGAVWGWLDRGGRRPVSTAALAGALGWAALLAFDAMRGPLGGFAHTLGGVMRLPGWALLLVTVAYGAALAGCAAAAARGLAPVTPRDVTTA